MSGVDLTEARKIVQGVLGNPHGPGMSWHPSREPTEANLQTAEVIILGDLVPLIEAQVREQVAQEIGAVMTDPDRLRPRADGAEFSTDLANDWQWCQMIARGAR